MGIPITNTTHKDESDQHDVDHNGDDDRSTFSWESYDQNVGGSSSGDSSRSDVSPGTTTRDSSTVALNAPGGAIGEEERHVRRAKCVVGFAFIACAVAMTAAVYYIAKSSDERSFEIEYEGYIKDIMALVVWEVRYNFALMEQLSASITIASHLTNSTFPFHTEPEFEITGGFVDGMGGIMSAAFAPFVTTETRDEWEKYAYDNQDWIENSAYLKAVHPVHRDALHGTIQDHEHDRRRRRRHLQSEESISREIFHWENGEKIVEESGVPGHVFAPLWQVSPADYSAINSNLFGDPRLKDLYDVMVQADRAVLSSNYEITDQFDFLFDPEEKDQKKSPHGFLLVPVYKEFVDKDPETVGILIGVTVFSNLLDRLLPQGKDGIIAVLDDNCGNTMSFELSSSKAAFLGYEDLHEPEFNGYERFESNLEMYEDESIDGLCTHDLRVYPSSKFRETFDSNSPAIYAGVVAIAFLGTLLLMLVYDFLVNRRQSKTVKVAARTQAIVTSLFPKEIGRKLVEEAVEDRYIASHTKGWKKRPSGGGQNVNSNVLVGGEPSGGHRSNAISKPMADLFPEATVMFGDIVGFTAWASTREPTQVFILLEGLYSAFDKIALRRKVMKIETVGDCYVAVCGLPDPNKDHAVTMVRFARDCMHQMHSVLHQLTVALGPDTTDLGIRIGINSGPVTAGVLRGDRARFQLFGDTVNTTARIESSGSKNRIHISQETANLLVAGGKESWVTPRETKIHAKGKGEMQTYWVQGPGGSNKAPSTTGSTADSTGNESTDLSSTLFGSNVDNSIVIEWNVELLAALLRDVVARREAITVRPDSRAAMREAEKSIMSSGGMPMDEVQAVIHLPKYKEGKKGIDSRHIKLPPAAMSQLKEYITRIGKMYNNNPFHNLEHANHVTMSVVKLLKRIVAPTESDHGDKQDLHDHTYGITSDPLTQFSVVLSALIHDLDHSGVPNTQLLAEKTPAAAMYDGKSIAEQHSFDLAWSLLMEDQFECLRRTIYTTKEELRRFRQMVVHTVMATDIMDKEQSKKRKERWNATFPDSEGPLPTDYRSNCSADDEVNRKATIVIEHLMQASDVAHTMQHWHVYSKWNGRLFKEMYGAYKQGRSSKDPSKNWYAGEIAFFDFYVIPLALKLQRCGVFGVFGDDYLNYARRNRTEWELKGKGIVQKLMQEIEEAS